MKGEYYFVSWSGLGKITSQCCGIFSLGFYHHRPSRQSHITMPPCLLNVSIDKQLGAPNSLVDISWFRLMSCGKKNKKRGKKKITQTRTWWREINLPDGWGKKKIYIIYNYTALIIYEIINVEVPKSQSCFTRPSTVLIFSGRCALRKILPLGGQSGWWITNKTLWLIGKLCQ